MKIETGEDKKTANSIVRNLSEALGLPDVESDWSKVLPGLANERATQAVKRSDVQKILSLAVEAISGGRQIEAANLISICLLAHESKTLKSVQEMGVLRTSKHNFRVAKLRGVVRSIYRLAVKLNLQGETESYLKSVDAILVAGRDVEAMVERLKAKAQKNPETYLKSVFAAADSLFMEDSPLRKIETESQRFSREALADGASFALYLFSQHNHIHPAHFNKIDEKGLLTGEYYKILVRSAKVRAFMESEILIDYFGYRATVSGGEVFVSPNDQLFEKSVQLGYILNDQARVSAYAGIVSSAEPADRPVSIFDIADYSYHRLRDSVVKYAEYPYRRITLQFSQEVVKDFLPSLPGYTLEEHLYLAEIQRNELMTWGEMEEVEVAEDLRAVDLINVFRVFTFMARFLEMEIKSLKKDELGLGYFSLLPVFKVSALSNLVASCLPGSTPEQVERVIRLLSSNIAGRGLYDIQYTPILQSDGYVLLPLNILAKTNWWRNISYTQKRRAITYADEEAASRLLYGALKGNVDDVYKNFKTRLGGKLLELDVVARIGEALYIFECKHPLVPCNAFELRTSLAHVRKGADQLSNAVEILSNDENAREFYRRLGWGFHPVNNIATCIVTCNGMFPGLREEGHPVRRIHELCNFIEYGKIRVGGLAINPSDNSSVGFSIDEIDVWGEGISKISSTLLSDYLEKDSLITPIFNSMEGSRKAIRLSSVNLVFSTFALNAAKLSQFYRSAERAGARF